MVVHPGRSWNRAGVIVQFVGPRRQAEIILAARADSDRLFVGLQNLANLEGMGRVALRSVAQHCQVFQALSTDASLDRDGSPAASDALLRSARKRRGHPKTARPGVVHHGFVVTDGHWRSRRHANGLTEPWYQGHAVNGPCGVQVFDSQTSEDFGRAQLFAHFQFTEYNTRNGVLPNTNTAARSPGAVDERFGGWTKVA